MKSQIAGLEAQEDCRRSIDQHNSCQQGNQQVLLELTHQKCRLEVAKHQERCCSKISPRKVRRIRVSSNKNSQAGAQM